MKIKRILISQPRPQNKKSPYFDIAEKNNVTIDFQPFNYVEGVTCKDFRKQRLDVLSHTGVIFNSKTISSNPNSYFRAFCGDLYKPNSYRSFLPDLWRTANLSSRFDEIFLPVRIHCAVFTEIYRIPEKKDLFRCRYGE